MAYFRHICNDADLDAALERISVLMDAKPGEHEYDELIVLTNLVEVYEDKHYRIGPAGFIDAIEFSMEQRGLTQDDLVPLIGSRQKVAEVLAGKRDITISMARALHKQLGIPAESLLQEPAASSLPS